jgi:hypothetical protein
MYLGFSYYKKLQFEELRLNAVEVQGRVFTKNCKNRGTFDYSYIVNNKEYQSLTSCRSNECDSLKVGDPITINYSSLKPSMSVCRNLVYEGSHFSTAVFWSIFISIIVGAGIYRVTRQTHNIKLKPPFT